MRAHLVLTIVFVTAVSPRAAVAASVAVAADAGAAAEASAPESPRRTFDPESRVFRSAAQPRVAMRIARGFRYLGNLEFGLGEKAWVDRHVFGEVEAGHIRRLIVFQFEGLLPGVEGEYRFGIPPPAGQAGGNHRFTPEPVALGRSDYVHNTWAFDHAAAARESPGREADQTLRFLAERDLALPNELVMSRFARIVGWEKRRELILFYLEPLAASGHSLADFPEGSVASASYDTLSAAVTARSLAAFRALDYPRIDANHSTLGFEVPIVGGISKVTGKFTSYDVDLVYDREEPAESSVSVRIEAASIVTGIDQRDEHLRTPDFFAVEEHPLVTFASTAVEPRRDGLEVSGVLSLRGVEKPLTLPVTVVDFTRGGDSWTAFSARWTLDRREFGIEWSHSDIPFFVGDEVTVDLVFVSR